MARSKFTFNEKALKKVANEAGRKIAARLSTMLNGMSSEFAGRPVEEIKPVLQARWRAAVGGSITDPELSEYAAKIAAGETFDVKVNVR
ncbi:hypothetical protein [Streptomyces sp. W4I9-2]|uniref:hypothetical protein n=1 Tax=Streptomyces sp. W4I9-2 TaxID=3042297 RepID=UPI0027870DA0|nr:hypothetical protein [Streptomyces sp. W4I9-2]MDQ0701085.1 hypothetical protein [Streptomyces sp. W4I9-2]